MNGRQFVEAEGVVHMVSPIQAEFTLCGDAFDLDSDIPEYEWLETRRRTVTCSQCATVVLGCRGVRAEQP